MSRLLEIRQRIQTVENIERITRTMATVAAARLSHARRRAAGLREYSARFREIVDHQRIILRTSPLVADSDLARAHATVKRVVLVLVTADRGMCGGYNLEVCRHALTLWEEQRRLGRDVRFIVIGRRGAAFLARRKATVLHAESWPRAGVMPADVERLLSRVVTLFRAHEADEIHVAFTEFHSAIDRRPRTSRLLPVSLEDEQREDRRETWTFEPNEATVISDLLQLWLRVQLYAMLLESHASEQGARMVTMEEATERADKTLQAARVEHHRVRRETITIDLLGALFASRVVGPPTTSPGARDE